MPETDIQLEQDPSTPVPSEQPQKQIRAALVRAWGKLPSVMKDRENTHAQSRYATLDSIIDTIKPVLAEHELMVTQRLKTSANAVSATTIIWHVSGEEIEFPPVEMPVKGQRVKGGGYSKDIGAQDVGSAITYARRYSILAALGISTGDDDDGEAAQRGSNPNPNAKAPRGNSRTEQVKNRIKDKPAQNEKLGEDRAQKMLDFAKGHGVTESDIRTFLKEIEYEDLAEQPIEEWPEAIGSRISTFIREHGKKLANKAENEQE